MSISDVPKQRKERGPKYYRWNNSKKEYELRKPYEFGDDTLNPLGKMVPLGLKNILIEKDLWKDYESYFEKNNIPIRVFDDLPKNQTKKKNIEKIDKGSPGSVTKKNITKKIRFKIVQPMVNVQSTENIKSDDSLEKPKNKTITIRLPKKPKKTDEISLLIPGLPLTEFSKKEEEKEEKEEEEEEEKKEEEEVEEAVEEPEYEPFMFSSYNKSDILYPELDDPNFNIKLAKHKEFFDTKYDGKIYDIKTQADILCNSDFELMPHQIFVKNFMSFNTPYNSLLMYFGLGSGKTCAAIGVAEETRIHMKQIGMRKSIFIIASPNVQDNFRLQLFDETKLKFENGIWSIQSCVGEALLMEINPTYLKSLSKERIINQIKAIIAEHYVFMGYTQFANFIQDSTEIKGVGYSKEEKIQIKQQKIKKVFNNRLIIIDEVHNIRITKENKNKKTAELLMEIAKQSDNMRLLLLSATPMYNSHEEIIWLTNLMNLNDNRSTIKISDIFDKFGDFRKKDDKNLEDGRSILIRKLTGYVSYIRGENPYSFPFRVYPEEIGFKNKKYPIFQMNGKPLDTDRTIRHIPVFLNSLNADSYQKTVYDFVVKHMKNNELLAKSDDISTTIQMDSFGYIALQYPLEALNIVYPFSEFTKFIKTQGQIKSTKEEESYLISNMLGSQGLENILSFKEKTGDKPMRYNYEYKNVENGRIFAQENIGKYSVKIQKICEMIKKSKGIILIYSQWIDAGLVPIALALEEMGFTRYGSETYTRSLFKDPPIEPIDALTMKSKKEMNLETGSFQPAKYMMITGDIVFSPNNEADLKYLNLPKNKNGEFVKVVLISKAAGEGVDFKNIRQIHVMEPWFNMNRIEQVIGRGVRNLSHCKLPFEERNVEIYLHGTIAGENETADLYIYRLAEQKSIKIGKVTRMVKETAVDCILNIAQTNFTVEKWKELTKDQSVTITIASGRTIDYVIGDKPYTEICDYMDNCDYTCSPNMSLDTIKTQIVQTTYNEEFLQGNREKIIKRIRDLFRDIPQQHKGKIHFREDELIKSVNIIKEYPIEQIYAALTFLINNKNELLIDRYGRMGRLINHGEYYIFQPIEISDEKTSIYDRSRPVDIKPYNITIELPEKRPSPIAEKQGSPELTSKQKGEEILQVESVIQTKELDEIMREIYENYRLAFLEDTKINIGEKNWYKNISVVITHLIEQHGISLEKIQRFVIYHNLDELSFSKKMVILNTVYTSNWKPIENTDIYIKEYFDERIVISDTGLVGITLSEANNPVKIYVQKNGIWKEAEFTDTNILLRSKNYSEKYIFNKNKLNQIIGFMSWVDSQNEYVFKIRDLNDSVNKRGARVSQALSKDLISKLNYILGEPIYSTEDIKKTFGEGKNRLAVILECLIREFQKEKKLDKIWFLTNEHVILNGILNYTRVSKI